MKLKIKLFNIGRVMKDKKNSSSTQKLDLKVQVIKELLPFSIGRWKNIRKLQFKVQHKFDKRKKAQRDIRGQK